MNTPLVKLSTRECQVLQARSYGLTIEETAEWLSLSPDTIKSHMRRILKRTGLKGCAAVIFTYRIAGKINGPSAQECHLSDLTSRELEVAELVCEGLTNKKIGRRLFSARIRSRPTSAGFSPSGSFETECSLRAYLQPSNTRLLGCPHPSLYLKPAPERRGLSICVRFLVNTRLKRCENLHAYPRENTPSYTYAVSFWP